MQEQPMKINRYNMRRSARNGIVNPPSERTPFDPARFPRQRQSQEPFDLSEAPPSPILEQTSAPIQAEQSPVRRRGRPRKQPIPAVSDKVGYDPNPTVIDDPPECDENVFARQPQATNGKANPDGKSTRKRTMPEKSAYPSPTGNPAMGALRPQTGRKRQRASVGTPAEVPDRSGVRDLPERMFTPSRATEIEATPLPDFPLSHDGDEPFANNASEQNLQDVSLKFNDLDGEDFDLDQNARNLRTVYQKKGKKREFDPQSVRLPSRSAANGTDTPIRRPNPSIPESPIEPMPIEIPAEPPEPVEPSEVQTPTELPMREHELGSGANKVGGYANSAERKFPIREQRQRLPNDEENESESRQSRRKSGSDGKRYYDDGALCGWMTDPDYGNATMGNDREQFHCISIIGQIEGHSLLPEGQKATKYEHIIPP